MISVAEALQLVLANTVSRPAETQPLDASRLGQVVAAELSADADSPPFDKSMMDGYAVRSADLRSSSVTLRVVEEIAAGASPTRSVEAGEASRIMTGAEIPQGADAIVPVEKTEARDAEVTIRDAEIRPGQFVIRRGQEMKANQPIIFPGTRITPQLLGILATVGRTEVDVYPRPRVNIVSTGNEIVEASATPAAGQIRNSNAPMLVAQVTRGGAIANYQGIARDEPDALTWMLKEGLANTDILIISGGVSMGDFDLIPGTLNELGVRAIFHKLAMKPGKPLFFGTLDNTLIFGLPGNPVSAFVGFELFVRPAIQKMLGEAQPGPTIVQLPLAEKLTSDNNRPTYLPARIDIREGKLQVSARPWFGSADLLATATTNALIAIPPGKIDMDIGTMVSTLLLDRI